MEIKVKGKFTIDCNRCGKSYDFLAEDIVFSPENKNGEQTYVWEKSYNCVKCGNPISIRYEVTFASDGTINDKNVEVSGAKLISDTLEFKR